MTLAAIARHLEIMLRAGAQVGRQAVYRTDQVSDCVKAGATLVGFSFRPAQALAYDVRFGQFASTRFAFDLGHQFGGQSDSERFHSIVVLHGWQVRNTRLGLSWRKAKNP